MPGSAGASCGHSIRRNTSRSLKPSCAAAANFPAGCRFEPLQHQPRRERQVEEHMGEENAGQAIEIERPAEASRRAP